MYISFSSSSVLKLVKFADSPNVVPRVEFITVLPGDKLILSADIIGMEFKEPNLPAKVVDVVKEDSQVRLAYKELEEKCSILGITPEDYIKQNKPSLF